MFIAVPVLASAASVFTGTGGIIEGLITIINSLITLAAGASLLAFIWGLAKFIFKVGGDEKAVAEGKRIMQWGIIAFFVMISLLGIIAFIQSELGIDAYIPTDNQLEADYFRPGRSL